MHNSPQSPKKVKVRVIGEEKLPTTIDLQKEIRGETMATMKPAGPAQEPDWRERYLRLAADLDNSKKRLAQS